MEQQGPVEMSEDGFVIALYPLIANGKDPGYIRDLYTFADNKSLKFGPVGEGLTANSQLDSLLPGDTPLPYLCSPEPDWRNEAHFRIPWHYSRKRQLGISIGASKLCDIIVPLTHSYYNGVGEFCGVFFFDDQYRLAYRDMRDPTKAGYGSVVTFNGMGGEQRRGFTWILSGTPFIKNEVTEIILQVHPKLRFRIDIPWHDNEEFRVRVDAHRTKHKIETPEGDLELSLALNNNGSQTTALGTGAHTLSTAPILVTDHVPLGRGGFGIVNKKYDVSTGQTFARKTHIGFGRLPDTHRFLWNREIEMMSRVNIVSNMNASAHQQSSHIIKMIFGSMDPDPVIDLEYAPLGSLAAQMHDRRLLHGEIVSVLEQVLKALTFLHSPVLNITHRDIKPANVLVMARASYDASHNPPSEALAAATIYVKLADFGLAKEDDLMTMGLGTSYYMAPEQYQTPTSSMNRVPKYTNAVDIWATGVMVYEMFYGLVRFPRPPDRGGHSMWASPESPQLSFCRAVMDTIRNTQGAHEAVVFAGAFMVCMDPSKRSSAPDCLSRFVPMATINASAPPSSAGAEHSSAHSSVYAASTVRMGGSTVRPAEPTVQPTERPGPVRRSVRIAEQHLQ
ncbi:camk protein kinase [Ophiostoma piceae UAMH 11346]|uniref:Camk protein kinase n=1 Tax=Ophiostoma piceae (strain UAMH 11346) TaxID=1262450 RepID=S3CX53_OPHP1|nr:camk protein kinase [Ophiostoma piceae UAMH 11346]